MGKLDRATVGRFAAAAVAAALATFLGISLLAHASHAFHPAPWRRALLGAWLGAGYAAVLVTGRRRHTRVVSGSLLTRSPARRAPGA